MLTNLHVKNLALIDEAEVEFGPGLNILTGETGAGKSILIGSINAALGKKISREMIRTGETSALVELVFETENPHVLELLKEMDLEAEEGQVIISRKITGSRSVCRINGEACNISQVKALASLLLDIHGQHEHQSLLYPDRQIAILDAFAGTEAATAKGEVRALYQEWKNVRKELSAYELDEEARKREAAFLTFEINEIDQAELKEGEDEALETAYRKMGHAKKIAESLQTVYAITGYGAENSAGEQVGRAIRELQQAAVYDDALSGPSQTLSDIDGLLNDFNREISAYLSELTFSEEEYYETEKRLDEINRLKAKYGKTMEEIAAYREEQQKKLEKLENFESCRAALQEQLQKTEQKLDAAAHNLSKIRRNYAKRLETQIIEGLRDLNFLHVAFEISFEKTKSYTENGTDAVEFLISTNPGEAIRPLAKVVSGGELSRIMLAIKTILADRDETETLIFDEIDTGISGRTAQKVSEKMAQIGQRHQVICITHLPQIAAMADSHFEIEKNVEENETVTSIHPLSEEDSVRELARMLGGAKITDSVLANASEMKESVVSLFFAGGESKSVPARELDDRRENKEMPQFCPAAERMGMQMTRKQKYRRVLLALAALFLILAVLLGYDAMRESLPDTMYVDENSESPFQPLTKHPLLTISEDTKEAEKNEFGETGETVVECSAAGIPLKKIRVIQEERPKVAVCGAPVGIYMETDGVMVIRTAEIRSSDGTVSRPSENILREGDYITKVNGQSIRSKQELIDAVKVSNGSPVCLSLLRDGETIEVQVTPQKSQDGTCRLGAWVRDNMQGIGTLTFVEPDGTFAALGHGISDVDTGKMLQLNGGELYLTQILSVIPGKAGVPGELQGVIHYEEKNRIGSVAENTIYGIHGVLDREKSSALPLTVTEIAYRQEIETGPATVRMCVDNTVEEYEAEITEIDLGSENTNKNFVLEITDQRLLQKTGGIVQGNSGSPVLQNGRLIGAITHVFVNHPEKGYGVFAENMLARN